MACLSRQFTWGHVEIATNYGVESVWIWIAVHASIRSNLDAGCGIAGDNGFHAADITSALAWIATARWAGIGDD